MLAKSEETQWIADIKSGKRDALDKLYTTYRTEFLKWMQHSFSCQEDDALDIFQDSIIVVYEHIKSGKLEVLSSSLKTYLFAVGRRVFLNKNKSKKPKTNNIEDYVHLEGALDTNKELNDRQKIMLALLNKLREPCRSIIYLFYYKRYSLEAITETMNYSSTDVVKTQKVRCMKMFKKIVTQKYKKGEI